MEGKFRRGTVGLTAASRFPDFRSSFFVPACAPVALFVYNRPDHTRQTLEALAQNRLADATTLYVFSDGPKAGASPADVAKIIATRKLVCSRPWVRNIILVESEINRGLADSIVGGVNRVVEEHGRVIVLEDD